MPVKRLASAQCTTLSELLWTRFAGILGTVLPGTGSTRLQGTWRMTLEGTGCTGLPVLVGWTCSGSVTIVQRHWRPECNIMRWMRIMLMTMNTMRMLRMMMRKMRMTMKMNLCATGSSSPTQSLEEKRWFLVSNFLNIFRYSKERTSIKTGLEISPVARVLWYARHHRHSSHASVPFNDENTFWSKINSCSFRCYQNSN